MGDRVGEDQEEKHLVKTHLNKLTGGNENVEITKALLLF